jgi:hypothetical protein
MNVHRERMNRTLRCGKPEKVRWDGSKIERNREKDFLTRRCGRDVTMLLTPNHGRQGKS